MKKILRWGILLFLLLLIVLVTRTFLFHTKQLSVAPIEKIAVSDSAVQRLVAAVQTPTVSNQFDSLTHSEYFDSLHVLLEKGFPLAFDKLQKENTSSKSLLLSWKGSDAKLKPVIFLAHQDVVPAEEQQSKWIHSPFSGTIDSGFINGRGTLDDKSGVLGLFESVEYLLGKDFQPQRTIYFAFGHDEEVGGSGAMEMAEWFSKKNIEAEFILDEGGKHCYGCNQRSKRACSFDWHCGKRLRNG